MNASMTAAIEVREQDRLAVSPTELPDDTPGRGSGRRLLANALRMLAIDAVEAANSGHPGMPMGMADIAEALWRRHLRHDPTDPAGLTATASCCRTGTAPCCSTPCCT